MYRYQGYREGHHLFNTLSRRNLEFNFVKLLKIAIVLEKHNVRRSLPMIGSFWI